MMKGIVFRLSVISVGLLLLIGLAAIDTAAQRPRKKKRSTGTSTVQPVAAQTEPVIVSTADQFPDPDAQIIAAPQEQTSGTAAAGASFDDLAVRIRKLESLNKNDYDTRQKRLSLNLDILSKAEERSDSLHKQLFDMIDRETTIKTRLDTIDVDVRPESIEKSVALAGTLRPEELRAMRRKSLEAERNNLQTLLVEVQRQRSLIEANVFRSDSLVDRLRLKLEKDIDDALADTQKP